MSLDIDNRQQSVRSPAARKKLSQKKLTTSNIFANVKSQAINLKTKKKALNLQKEGKTTGEIIITMQIDKKIS